MKVSFFSNFLTHHQKPFSDEMYKMLKEEYIFVSTDKITIEKKKLGYKEEKKSEIPYLIEVDKDQFEIGNDIAIDSDLVIIGSAPIELIKKRLEKDYLTFFYSERLFKNFKSVFIMVIKGLIINLYYLPSKKKNVYMLCASAYTSWDLKRIGSYKNKTYKWGYFTEVIKYDIDELMLRKKNSIIKLLWVGRFISLKHTEDAIKIAKKLKDNGYRFTLDIIGNGKLESHLKFLVRKNNLEDTVSFLGSMKQEQVRKHMEKANIFLFTSDFNEGWGAVLNEAMNSGCAVIASHAIGSVPFLIKDGENGIIYKNGDIKSLYHKVSSLINNFTLCEQIGISAYKTMSELWNPKVASERLLILANDLKKYGTCERFDDGPCSKAKVIFNNWYR